jgi:uncharacterized protein (TIGR00290 family)
MDEHRQWVEQICRRCWITPHLPLWGEDQSRLVQEFIDVGFKAIIVATDAGVMGEEWLGREVDVELMSDLARYENITPCGEAGEFHTFVTDGPVFIKSLNVIETEKILRGDHWFLNIKIR